MTGRTPDPTAEDTGPTRGELAAARKLIEKANPPGTWSAHPRAPEKFDWPAWCVNARSRTGTGGSEVTVIPEIGSDNANAIAAAMNWAIPLIDRLAAVEAALDEAMPNRTHNREPAFYVRHLAAVRDAALAGDPVAERDLLLLAMERVMLGKAPTAEERDIALGAGGPLADVEFPTSAGIIAAAAPELVRRMRARGEGR